MRPQYEKLLRHLGELSPSQVRTLVERMEATLREMGVTFDFISDTGTPPVELRPAAAYFHAGRVEDHPGGIRQRLQAFDLFLQDIDGRKEILRDGDRSRFIRCSGAGITRWPQSAFPVPWALSCTSAAFAWRATARAIPL